MHLYLSGSRSNTGRSRSDCRGQRRERRSLPSGRLGAYLTTSRREVPPAREVG
ncbi:hypothetical protein GCWU000341_00142 [Oribacterium sp. oral taxon 078 str. F0262]|nr:hypothetical protein GCWU000341_00142 [Oribacterium sp. oral taxon 078 str. F0262]